MTSNANVPSCPLCGKDKLVRAETVVKAGMSYIEFYCAACRHAWQVPEREDENRVFSDEPTAR